VDEAGEDGDDCSLGEARFETHPAQHLAGEAMVDREQPEQDVFTTDVVVSERECFLRGGLQDAPGRRVKGMCPVTGSVDGPIEATTSARRSAGSTSSDSITLSARLPPSSIMPTRTCSVPT